MDFGGNRGLDSRPSPEALDRRLHIHNVFKNILIFKSLYSEYLSKHLQFEVQLQIYSQTVSILKFLFKMHLGILNLNQNDRVCCPT